MGGRGVCERERRGGYSVSGLKTRFRRGDSTTCIASSFKQHNARADAVSDGSALPVGFDGSERALALDGSLAVTGKAC